MVDMEREDMDQMYSETIKDIEAGSVVKGKVVQILDDVVMVDVGYKSEGQIPISEFMGRDGHVTVEVGDEVEVFLERLDGDLGTVRLSKRKADRVRAWQEVIKAYEKGKPVYGVVESQVKGGFFVDIGGGLRAFLPYSHADLRPVRDVEDFIGRKFAFKVVKIDESKYNVVVSRKEFLEEERKRKVEELMKELKVGAVFEGRVKNITNYGAFVDIGGLDGLLHISDISYERIKHPSELLSVGDRIKVMVKDLSEDKKRISLSMKALKPDPWEKAKSELSEGSRVKARVKRIFDFGVLTSIAPGVDGFIPISEIAWVKKRINPSDFVSPGDEVEAVVLGVDERRKRFVLSLKKILPNPWEDLDVKEGDELEGTVSGIADFGVFVEIKDGVEGLVHVSEVTWLDRNPDLGKMFSVGDRVRVRVLSVDKNSQRISLSLKALEENPWEVFKRDNPPGSIVTGTVTGHADFGIFVKVGEGLEGLVHFREIPRVPGKKFEELYPKGKEVRVAVIDVDPEKGRIALSIKGAEEKEEEAVKRKYSEPGRLGNTLGSILEEKDPTIASLIKEV